MDIPSLTGGSSLTLESNFVVSHLACCTNQSLLSIFAIVSGEFCSYQLTSDNHIDSEIQWNGNGRLYKFNVKKKGIEIDPLLLSFTSTGEVQQVFFLFFQANCRVGIMGIFLL